MTDVGIGIIGLGTVGCGVLNALHRNQSLLAARTGYNFKILKAVVRDLKKTRSNTCPLPPITTNWKELIEDKNIHIIVELMGGIQEAKQLFHASLAAKKPIVTGNKALLASHGSEIFSRSEQTQTPIFFEAAVAGGIPIIKSVRESLVGNRIELLQAILNGTCNYILTQMSENGLDFSTALSEAQRLGFAEADPSLDIDGWDAAHKAVILASLAYGKWISLSEIYVQGISRLTPMDFAFASELDCSIKLLATLRVRKDGRFEARVCPTLIPKNHVLASVRGVFNAVWLRGDTVGETLFYGRGAGADATASSVIADLVEAANWLENPNKRLICPEYQFYQGSLPSGESVSDYYLRLEVEDRPGVLAQVAGILGADQIGISSVIQHESPDAAIVPLALMLHEAPLAKTQFAVEKIARLECVKSKPLLLPAER